MCGLALKTPQRPQLALRFDHSFDGLETEGADQLVFKVRIADIEAGSLEVFATREVVRKAGALQRPHEVLLLLSVDEPHEPDSGSIPLVLGEKPSDGMSATDRHHRDAGAGEVVSKSPCHGLERNAVAVTFDDDRRAVRRLAQVS